MPPLFFLLSAWGVLFVIFAGIGLFIRRRLCAAGLPNLAQTLPCFWIGWACALFFLQIWHLFFAVNMAGFFIIGAWGLAGLWENRNELNGLVRASLADAAARPLLLAMAALAVVAAYQSSRLSVFYDLGLYYLPTVHWTNAFPIVPGLGNLHARLAFNQSYHLYTALLDTWSRAGTCLAGGILLLAFFAEILGCFLKIWRTSPHAPLVALFGALMWPPVFDQLFLVFLPSASPDLAVFFVSILTASGLLRLLSAKEKEIPDKDFLVFYLIALVFLGITIKVTFLIFGGCALLIAGRFFTRKILRWGLVTAVLSLGIWMIRSVILTGYPVFPLPWAGLPVDWRIPHASVANIWHALTAYAHQDLFSRADKGFWLWLPLGLALLGFVAACLDGGLKKMPRKIWLFPLPGVAAAFYWILAAPNLRFGMALFWILAAAGMTLWLKDKNFQKKFIASYVLLLTLFILAFDIDRYRPDFVLAQSARVNEKFKGQPWPADRFVALQNLSFRRFRTASGLDVYVPATEDKCWDTSLACTPYTHPGLALRDLKRPGRGFRIEPFDEQDATVGYIETEVPGTSG